LVARGLDAHAAGGAGGRDDERTGLIVVPDEEFGNRRELRHVREQVLVLDLGVVPDADVPDVLADVPEIDGGVIIERAA
jgi:hypothetical protein